MGYRLEISKVEYLDCGGKLFGYINTDELHKCKSWQWLKKRGYLDKEDEDSWDYGYDHSALLGKDEYKEFIELYIEDFNKYYHDTRLSLDDFKKSLAADDVQIEWF